MEFTRRNILALGSGAFAAASFAGMPAFASKTDDAIAAFTGGASVTEGGIDLTAPEIAENGNTVPVSVSAPGAVSIMLLATGNPTPAVATFNLVQWRARAPVRRAFVWQRPKTWLLWRKWQTAHSARRVQL